MKRKSKDYYKQIAEQEKKSSELNNKIDRELSCEERKLNMADRVTNLCEVK